MRARFWGTRGSLPVALSVETLRRKITDALINADGKKFADRDEAARFVRQLPFDVGGTFGGASSCVELELSMPTNASREYFLCDLGSGAREFGHAVLQRHGPATPNVFHIFLSHTHWDHIMGFPFFAPAYIPGNTVRIYGCHDNLEAAMRRQQDPPSFPVPLDYLKSNIQFVQLAPGVSTPISQGLSVTGMLQLHAQDSYGYRFEHDGKTLIYSTDSEHKLDSAEETERFARFFKDADLVIFDAMYSLADTISVKADWGHSSNMVAVELCQLAGARHLALFHHEPMHDDAQIVAIEQETRHLEQITRGDRQALRVTAAYDGLEIDV